MSTTTQQSLFAPESPHNPYPLYAELREVSGGRALHPGTRLLGRAPLRTTSVFSRERKLWVA